jgi:hypothetical protein
MSDEELYKWLGCDRDDIDHDTCRAYIVSLSPERRLAFERMRAIELWETGLGPKPSFLGNRG